MFFRTLVLCLLVAPARAADTGTITGIIDKPQGVTAVTAVRRADDKKFPGKVDKRTGKFTIPGVPLGAKFDVIIDAGPVRLEGVNLKVPRSDYEEEQPLTREEAEKVRKKALELNQFEDKVEVMTVRGNIQHAAVLLNKLRTKPFVNSTPGECVWRLELWHFEKPDDAWFKVQDELFVVLYRERLQKKDFDNKALTLDPKLGGIALSARQKTADLGKVALPANTPGIRLRPVK